MAVNDNDNTKGGSRYQNIDTRHLTAGFTSQGTVLVYITGASLTPQGIRSGNVQ